MRLEVRIKFLRKCIIYNVTSQHLNFCTRYPNNLYHRFSRGKHDKLIIKFVNDILKNEIRDAYRHIRTLRRETVDLVRVIARGLPISMYDGFFSKQCRSQQSFYRHKCARLENKFNWLLYKQRRAMHINVDPIRYFCGIVKNKSTDQTSVIGQPLSVGSNVNFSLRPAIPASPSSSFSIGSYCC